MTNNLPRIAVVFFGITRSLTHTMDSIEKNILSPARKLGDVKVYAHFFEKKEIRNERSGEYGSLRADEHEMLKPDWLRLEPPEACLQQHGFEALAAHGDAYSDGFQSLKNIVHQQHSLHVAASAALDWKPDLYLFCRPDLRYHDDLSRDIAACLSAETDHVRLPEWQQWDDGYNDRFAICKGQREARCYSGRIEKALLFCEKTGRPMHAEALLKFALQNEGIKVSFMKARASRVRFDGTQTVESFLSPKQEEKRSKAGQLEGRAWSAFEDGQSVFALYLMGRACLGYPRDRRKWCGLGALCIKIGRRFGGRFLRSSR